MRDLIDYQKEYISNNPFEKYMVKFRRNIILEQLKKNKSKKILEIGCGVEPIFEYLNCFDKYVVVEPGKKFYEIASEKASNNNKHENIVILNQYFKGINEKINDFDFIICSGLLHEIENQTEFLSYISEVAKNDTVIHISVPNAYSFHRLLAVKAGIIESVYQKSENEKKFQRNNVFSMRDFINLVKANGFKIKDKGFFSFKPFTHRQMQDLLDKEIINEKIVKSLSEMVEYVPEFGAEMYLNLTI